MPIPAVRSFDRAVDLLSRNTSDYDRGELALSLCERAEANRGARDLARAEADLGRAEEIQTGLVRAHAGNAYWQWILARIQIESAALRAAQGRTDEARPFCDSALRLARTLHEGEHTDKSYALVLSRALLLSESLGRLDETRPRDEQRAFRCAWNESRGRAGSPMCCPIGRPRRAFIDPGSRSRRSTRPRCRRVGSIWMFGPTTTAFG